MSRAYRLSQIVVIALSLFLVHPKNLHAGTACPEMVGATNDVVTGDFDGDGLADMAAIGDAKIVIVFGDSGARPTRLGGTIVTGITFGNLAAGDWNGDGALDLVAGTAGGDYLRVLLGDGTGSFTFGGIFEATNPYRMAAGDFNGDGHLDIGVLIQGGMGVLYGDGIGGFGAEQVVLNTPLKTWDLAAGDLNGDGRADLMVVLNDEPYFLVRNLAVFLGNADGSFSSLPAQDTPFNAYALALGDMNEDGRLDVVAGGGSTAVYPGNGDGSFDVSPELGPGRSGGRIRVGDVDGDGHLDAVSVGGPGLDFSFCPSNTIQFFHGGGDGTLTTPQMIHGHNMLSLSLGDVNGDGYVDASRIICDALIVQPGSPSGLQTLTNPARAFVIKNNGIIRLNSNKAAWCVHIEGVNGSVDVEHDYPNNLVLVSEGTGSQSTAGYIFKQYTVLGDVDENGVPDAEYCFPKDQLRLLFDGIHGRQTVNVRVEGDLGTLSGCRFSASLTIEVIPGGSGQAAAMMPSVFATESMLSLQTEVSGNVRVRVFDVSGRLVKTLQKGPSEAGAQQIRVDARDASGKPLPSGVYFFRVDSPNGPESGRFVIAR